MGRSGGWSGLWLECVVDVDLMRLCEVLEA